MIFMGELLVSGRVTSIRFGAICSGRRKKMPTEIPEFHLKGLQADSSARSMYTRKIRHELERALGLALTEENPQGKIMQRTCSACCPGNGGKFTIATMDPYKSTCGCEPKNRGIPKWMVYFMENPINIDDLGVFPYFWKHPCLFHGVL